jgi:hypothetical protein
MTNEAVCALRRVCFWIRDGELSVPVIGNESRMRPAVAAFVMPLQGKSRLRARRGVVGASWLQ